MMQTVMETNEFQAFGKIARLSRQAVLTEKIDGTNASILIGEAGEFLTGARLRWITPEVDNFGFSRWAHDHKEELLELGPGRHFGEYWGRGIQRNYGLEERRFSLFNTYRWCAHDAVPKQYPTQDPLVFESQTPVPACCSVVPVLYEGAFHTHAVDTAIELLRITGSHAAPGFMNPEGVVIFHVAGSHYYKKTCEHDDEPKLANVRKVRKLQTARVLPAVIMWTGGRRKGATPGFAGTERRQAA